MKVAAVTATSEVVEVVVTWIAAVISVVRGTMVISGERQVYSDEQQTHKGEDRK